MSTAAKTWQDRNVPAVCAVEAMRQSLPTGRSLPRASAEADSKATPSDSGKQPKSSLKLEEQRLKARLFDHADGSQSPQLSIQVGGARLQLYSLISSGTFLVLINQINYLLQIPKLRRQSWEQVELVQLESPLVQENFVLLNSELKFGFKLKMWVTRTIAAALTLPWISLTSGWPGWTF